MLDLLIRGGRVLDGSGNPWFRADLGLSGDRIAWLGSGTPPPARRTLDARGCFVSPGFIDMLGQSEYNLLLDPHCLSKITQGITSEITGEGHSIAPHNAYTLSQGTGYDRPGGIRVDWQDLAGYWRRFRRNGCSLNLGTYVGSAQVREIAMGGVRRRPRPAETRRMRALVDQAMRQGALGLSSALIYAPNSYMSGRELTELCKPAAAQGGIYATHMRSEGSRIFQALDEVAAICRGARIPAEIWHLKCAGPGNWGKMSRVLAKIESFRARGLDISADQYPYSYSATDLNSRLPLWAFEGGKQALLRRLGDSVEREKLKREMLEEGFSHVILAGVRSPRYRKYQGWVLSKAARAEGRHPVDFTFDILAAQDGSLDAVFHSMSEDDVRLAMTKPWLAVNCDSGARRPTGPLARTNPHPRAYGSFPRLLGRYVRELKLLSWEQALRKMTGLAAQRMKLKDRGLLKEGFFADICVFDPAKVLDRATIAKPHQFAAGIRHVLVNGVPVIRNGRPTFKLPGRPLLGPGRA